MQAKLLQTFLIEKNGLLAVLEVRLKHLLVMVIILKVIMKSILKKAVFLMMRIFN